MNEEMDKMLHNERMKEERAQAYRTRTDRLVAELSRKSALGASEEELQSLRDEIARETANIKAQYPYC